MLEHYTQQFKDMLSAHTQQLAETQEATQDMKASTEILELQLAGLQEHLVRQLSQKIDEAISEAVKTRPPFLVNQALPCSGKPLAMPLPSLDTHVAFMPCSSHSEQEGEEILRPSADQQPSTEELPEAQEMPHGDLPGQVPDMDTPQAPGQLSRQPTSESLANNEKKPEEEGETQEDETPATRRRASVIFKERESIAKRLGAVSRAMRRGRPTTAQERKSDLSFQELKDMYGIGRKSARTSKVKLDRLGWFRRKCFHCSQHARFEPACAVLMMFCALGIGAEAHHSMQPNAEAEKDLQFVFRCIDLTFNGFFTLELIIRFFADGLYFVSCSNSAVRWNYMDISLVSTAWLQEVVEVINALTATEDGEGGISISSLRLLRMLRLVRVARILRVVRFFSELRVMVNGILGSAKSLLWAFLLLVLVMFTVGVGLMQFAAMYLNGEKVNPETAEGLRQYYGSMLRTLLTLYMAISGGIDWQDAVIPLREISIFLELLFVGYAFFTIFCCLNIVTGIFVDNAKILKQADEEAMFQEALAERRRWITEVAELFNKVNEGEEGSGSGEFTFEQFKLKMRDIRVQTIFRKLGINTDTTSPEELWEILDTDASGQIDQEEFANGIKHFHGDAKNIDLYRLRRDGERLNGKLQAKLDGLNRAVSTIGARLQQISFSFEAVRLASTASAGHEAAQNNVAGAVADEAAIKKLGFDQAPAPSEGLRAIANAWSRSPPRPEDDISPRPPSKAVSPKLFST